MATAVELTFQTLPYLPAGPIRFVGTLGTIADVEIQTSGTFYVPFLGDATSFDVTESSLEQGMLTGSFLGDATSFGFIETPDIPATMSGSYFVNSINSDFYEIPAGEKNHNETSSDNPTPAEIGTNFEWNHFPIPEVVTPEATSPRDLTRFKKAYSFTRQQPVRVRIYRR